MIVRSRETLQNGRPSEKMLGSVIAEHQQNLPRLEKLRSYYMADSAILKRSRSAGQPNNRVAHPFARYITTVATGYLIGEPVSYSAKDDSAELDGLTDAYRRANIESVDLENARNASIYGRGVEYIHLPQAAEGATAMQPCATALDPRFAFVVYDDTYEMLPLFGVYYAPKSDETGLCTGWRVWVMTGSEIIRYTAVNLGSNKFSEEEVQEHFFGGVPLVEYWNDENERGDFEWIITLIDAYDKLQSDRVNDKERFVDALLVLIGCTMDADEQGRSPARQLREDKMLSLPDGDADVRYLTAQMDENGAEILRAALVEDIHKLSMVPNLSDKDFASNASGVAMRYKLWGLEQLINVKQQWFTEGLRQRMKLFFNFMGMYAAEAVDVADVQITFTRALPANQLEQAQIAQTAAAADAASTETLVRILHGGENWNDARIQAEAEKIEAANKTPDLLTPFRQTNNPTAEDEAGTEE